MTQRQLLIHIEFTHKCMEDGGRPEPIFSGYRPDWQIGCFHENGRPRLFIGMLELDDPAPVPPGESGTGTVWVRSPEYWKHLEVGDQIEFGEGPHVVASAIITGISERDFVD